MLYFIHGDPQHVIALVGGAYWRVSLIGGWAQRVPYTGDLRALMPFDSATSAFHASNLNIPTGS